ncbi:MAG: T9SS type A sorting domain-containing protein [Bacteroidetes bacterium]|nr:T9SS type A sorting domain-containing protein [Bacteroidota bacterium]
MAIRRIIWLLLFCFLWVHTEANTFFRSVDITTRGSGNPLRFFIFKNRLYFTATDSVHGYELWSSDGTPSGTKMFADLTPGISNSVLDNYIIYHNKLYFQNIVSYDSLQIWCTDGTTWGTQLIKTVYAVPAANPYHPSTAFTLCNDKLFFAADSGQAGSELWISDGTTAGTYMLKDINPTGTGISGSSYPEQITAYNGNIYFTANDAIHGVEMWESDGTTAGTQLLRDINPGPFHSNPRGFTVFINKMWFFANDSTHGSELWTSNGTTTGTYLFLDINPGSASSGFSKPFEQNNILVFTANDGITGTELWITDGTQGKTIPVADINRGSNGSNPHYFSVCGKRLYFVANDGIHGTEPWVTDFAANGTHILRDIAPGSDGSYPSVATPYAGQFYFEADAHAGDAQLYESDGTETGTNMLQPANAYNNALVAVYQPAMLPILNGALYFPAYYNDIGNELWSLTNYLAQGVTSLSGKDMNIYPNPNHGSFTINTGNADFTGRIHICDVAGREVYYNNSVSGMEINVQLPSAAAGLYFLKICSNTGISTYKIVVR